MKKDFLSVADWSTEEIKNVLDLSKQIKISPKKFAKSLEGKSIALIFEKQSLRTHVTFEIGLKQMGANTVYLTQADISLGARESIHDVAKNLERWVDAIIIRTYDHKKLEELASHAKISVINALSDFEHPCQVVGDFYTIQEKFGKFNGLKFAWIGDGNNVCHSLMLMSAKMGVNFIAVTPSGLQPNYEAVDKAMAIAGKTGAHIELSCNPTEGVQNANVIYTDVWVSMGQESERETKMQAFEGFQINSELLKLAHPNAVFMHCLPAHRGEEVTDEVIDSPQSIVFDQAENRLHTQKAIVYALLTNQKAQKKNTSVTVKKRIRKTKKRR